MKRLVVLATALAVVLAAQSTDWQSEMDQGKQARLMGPTREAEKHFKAALEIAEKTPGGDALVADSLENLAHATNSWGKAEALFRRALAIRERIDGPDALSVGITLTHMLRAVCMSSGAKAAEPLFDQAIAIETRAAGEDSPPVAVTLLEMAKALHSRLPKNPDPDITARVETLYTRALAIREKSAIPADLALAEELYSLFLTQTGHPEKAEVPLNRARGIRRERIVQMQDPPAPAAPPPANVDLKAAVVAPKLIAKAEPVYTEVARQMKVQGAAVLYIVVNAVGLVERVRLVRGLGFGLDENAVEAVRLWRFEPGTKDGQRVPVAARVEVNFRLL